MIDIDKIKGKSVKYVGGVSLCFSKGQLYRIGFDDEAEQLFTIDDDGDYHHVTTDYIKNAFDVSEYIVKPRMVGRYVRYIGDGSDFMRRGDIGIVITDINYGMAFDVRWLNPIQPHTKEVPTWWAHRDNLEFL